MSSLSKQRLFACAAVAAFTMIGPQAFAGEITTLAPEPGIYSIAGQSVATPNAGNLEHVGDDNTNILTVVQKHYFAALPGPSVAPVDIVMSVIDSGGTTEYKVIENVQNSTGVDWIGYRVELGFGVGGGFVQSTPGDGLDFDDEDNSSIVFDPMPADFSIISRPSEDVIEASGGTLLDGQFSGTDFIWHIDVPDGITQFTLRQQPILVPEPTSATAILAMGALLLRRRRSRG